MCQPNPSYNTLKQWNLAVSADVKPMTFVAYQGGGYNLTYIEAQTAQHRANAYPKLVDALREIHQQRIGLTQEANPLAAAFCDKAGALLRELGEAS